MNSLKNNFFILSFIILYNLSFNLETNAQEATGIYHTFEVTTPVVAFPPTFNNVSVPPGFISEWDTLLVPLGWTFNFEGINYTRFVISSNGWIALIPGTPVSNPLPYPTYSNPNNLLSNNATGYPIVAPLWDDLSTSLIRFNVTSNVLSVQWYIKWQAGNTTSVSSLFWVELNGNTNTIGFHYFNNSIYVPLSPSASIGIAGICPGDFYSVSCPSASTAFIDSINENTSIGDSMSNNFRPYNVNYLFTPYHPYDSCSGNYSARDMGTINSACTNILASTFNSSASGTGNCSTTDDNDVWFKLIKPIGTANVIVITSPASCQSVTGTSVEVLSSCGNSPLDCSTTSSSYPNFGKVSLVRSTSVSETLYVRVTSDGDVPGKFNICASSDLLAAINEEHATNSSLDVFPIPFTNEMNVHVNNNFCGNGIVKLFDLTGREIYSREIFNGNCIIKTEKIIPGYYFLVYADIQGSSVKRVLKY